MATEKAQRSVYGCRLRQILLSTLLDFIDYTKMQLH